MTSDWRDAALPNMTTLGSGPSATDPSPVDPFTEIAAAVEKFREIHGRYPARILMKPALFKRWTYDRETLQYVPLAWARRVVSFVNGDVPIEIAPIDGIQFDAGLQ